ncbi:predicted protein [Micromonas commoda]|uniref:Uncharacterized protein n=1 Tax=Micromonas commoda (strain RCC299 / NOUM17 / CCMP2709) TaxID=296587 RepID=C1FG76_MICCC|nr:predicted protein [Micromonas commoda]ACO69209.1 predicted protein [Micromonas commoda]|eukprot:XP_002507951.1 predicted protein [Micromonas commoda]
MTLTYSDAMVPYFGLYAFTMCWDPDMFWGPNGLGQLPYFSKELGDSTTAGGFFARMVGLGFLTMFLGKTRFGVSDDAWMKTTVTFHVGSLWWFYKLTTAAGWTTWVWQLQCLLNVVFAAWGVQSMGGLDKLLKQD